jgi:hypothetical protein
MSADRHTPDFDFKVPRGYTWLLERGIIGYANSPLEPWYYLDKRQGVQGATAHQPQGGGTGRLVSFARRGDSDDIACFRVNSKNEVDGVVLIHGWVPVTGYQVVATYNSFWDWLKSVIDDIAELIGEN